MSDVVLEKVSRHFGDFVAVNCPLSAATRHLVDARLLSLMKPTAYFINTARGPIVDQKALTEVLAARRIAGAGLDVFQTEPLPPANPLWALPNVFITPHLGGYTSDYENLIMPLIAENLRLYLDGRQSEMQNIVKR